MAKTATPESIAADLPIQARLLLFCLATGTDWVRAGIPPSTAQVMLVRGLVERGQVGQYRLTEQGQAVLDALLTRPTQP